jgi:hypothetical protein
LYWSAANKLVKMLLVELLRLVDCDINCLDAWIFDFVLGLMKLG